VWRRAEKLGFSEQSYISHQAPGYLIPSIGGALHRFERAVRIDAGPPGTLSSGPVTIRTKIVLVVLPLILAPLILTGVISTLSARNGITSIAAGLLQFKAEQLVTYADGQWNLLNANGLEGNPAYVEASKAAIESFAKSLVRSSTETIFALGPDGSAAIRSGELRTTPAEMEALQGIATSGSTGWHTIQVGGAEFVANLASFTPFHWTFVVAESSAAFYSSADAILRQAGYILGASLVASVVLLFLFARYLTRPLQQVVDAMSDIIATSDLSRRVEVLYKDETGRLGHTFNLMTEELRKAYDHIKSYALRAALSEIKETKIRHVFQRYVPKTVIESFFANPEAALVGENRILAILFSDIRGFTSISENMQPDQMVESLNNYFARMVEIVMRQPDRAGTVDKYIGDAIMALFGATERHEDDALRSVLTAFDMLDELAEFNTWQVQKKRAPFKIGIGINYGVVTVGNIGSEKKMDFTVIGDGVNLASRLEGLTKKYHEPIVVSDSVYSRVKTTVKCRCLGKVSVKGRQRGAEIYTVRRSLGAVEEKAWPLHEQALAFYYERKFREAAEAFREVHSLMPDDHCSDFFLRRCAEHIKTPPSETWTGVEEMTEK
jgi:adenylate cyclase